MCASLPGSSDFADFASRLGFFKVGVAAARPVGDGAVAIYDSWLANGRHAGMTYLEKYADVRRDPRLLLDGAKSVIICAMSYYHPLPAEATDAMRSIAMYARGDDYHEVVRAKLNELGQYITDEWGGQFRACVDTAPLRERYWAVEAGLGFIGLNNQLIIPGAGSYFFLGALITTVDFRPDLPMRVACDSCGRCVAACPGCALDGNGGLDARKCLSYLTIEHRGDFPAGTDLAGHLYGCDECQRVCPHNSSPNISTVSEFAPRQEYNSLTPDRVLNLSQPQFSTIFRHSPVKRTKLAGLQRNASML